MTSQPSTLHRALESWDWISKMVHFYVGPLPSANLPKVCTKLYIDSAEDITHLILSHPLPEDFPFYSVGQKLRLGMKIWVRLLDLPKMPQKADFYKFL